MKVVSKLLGVSLLAVSSFVSNASAVTINSNTIYGTSGSSASGYNAINIVLDSGSGQDYLFQVSGNSMADGDDILSLGSSNGGGLDLVEWSATFTMNVFRYDINSGTIGSNVGSLSGSLAGSWTGALLSSSLNLGAGKQGQVQGGLNSLVLSGNSSDLGNININLSSVAQKFAPAFQGVFGGIYDNVATLTNDTAFSIAFGNLGNGLTDAFRTWFMGDVNGINIGGRLFTLSGDGNVSLLGGSSVPEPATMSLFGLGLGAIAARRRKKA